MFANSVIETLRLYRSKCFPRFKRYIRGRLYKKLLTILYYAIQKLNSETFFLCKKENYLRVCLFAKWNKFSMSTISWSQHVSVGQSIAAERNIKCLFSLLWQYDMFVAKYLFSLFSLAVTTVTTDFLLGTTLNAQFSSGFPPVYAKRQKRRHHFYVMDFTITKIFVRSKCSCPPWHT